MDDACDELDSIINDETKDNLMKYFRHMASTFVVGTERMEAFAAMKLDDDVPVNNFSSQMQIHKEHSSDEDDYGDKF
jgi:hypothetical protein